MTLHSRRLRFVGLLVVATVATYVLIVLGTLVSTSGDGALLHLAHGIAALATGLALIATAVVARRVGVDRLTGAGIGVALVLFPIQVAIGATLLVSPSRTVAVVHLILAMGIFAGLLVALGRTLEVVARAHEDETMERLARDLDRDDGPDGRILTAEPPTTALAPATDTVPAPDTASTTDTAPAPDTASTTDTRTDAATGAESADESRGLTDHLPEPVRSYVALTKPRLMWLLCLVAVAGMGLAATTGATIDPVTAVATLLGGVLAIGAAGTVNQVYERDRDERMARTDDRPTVDDRVPAWKGYAFAAALVVAATVVLLVWVNVLATLLTLAAVVYYAVLYTMVLKPRTVWNTVLGGGAGALPALIGYAAVTGGVDLSALVLAGVIFLWTPAHFYSLAIAYREDYARGGFPMLPVVAGDLVARRHVLGYLGATMLAVTALGWIAGLGPVYALVSIALGVVFLRSVVRQYTAPTTDAALRSFYVSNGYLGMLLLAIVVESGLGVV